MKKILFAIGLLISVTVSAQYPPGYTGISARYEWLAGKFRALDIPGSNGVPSGLESGQYTGDGGLRMDTTNNRLYIYSGGSWVRVANFTDIPGASTPTLQQVITSGATLSASNTINVGATNSLTINNATTITEQTVSVSNKYGYFNLNSLTDEFLNRNSSSNGYAGLISTNNATSPVFQAALVGYNGSGSIDSIAVSERWIRLIADSVFTKVFAATAGTSDSAYTRDPSTGLMQYQAIGGTGGSKFGFPAEDVLSTGTRSFDIDGNVLEIVDGANGGIARIQLNNGETIINSPNGTYSMQFSNTGYSFPEIPTAPDMVNKGVLVYDSVSTLMYKIVADSISGGGGGGNTIYSADDALVSDRTVDLNGNSLNVIEGVLPLLTLDPGGYSTIIQSNTDASATVYLELQGNVGAGRVSFNLNADDGVGNKVEIEGDAPTKTLTYTADTHTFTGPVIFSNPARLFGYTVGTLPAGTAGDIAYVTDALLPSFLTTVAGGGAVVTPVFYDGTNWKSF